MENAFVAYKSGPPECPLGPIASSVLVSLHNQLARYAEAGQHSVLATNSVLSSALTLHLHFMAQGRKQKTHDTLSAHYLHQTK